MQRQELSGEPEEERLPSSPFVLSDSAFSRSQAAGGNAPGVGTRRLNELHQAETWQSSSLPHSPDSRSRQVPGPPKPVASQPRSALLRVQQEGFLRWWRAIRMDLGKEELAEQRRKAALLVILRQRSQSMIAVRHYVAALQRKAVSGFQRAADEEAISRRLSRRAKSRRANRASHRTHVGLRGMSAAEVMRKGWRRWRYAVLSGQRVVCQFERPANVTLKLCQIASEIDSCRSKVHGLEPCTPLVRSSSVDEAWSVLALPPPAEAVPEVPEHLRLLKQASVAFDDEQTGWLGRTSKGALPPSVLWEHASTVRQDMKTSRGGLPTSFGLHRDLPVLQEAQRAGRTASVAPTPLAQRTRLASCRIRTSCRSGPRSKRATRPFAAGFALAAHGLADRQESQ